MNSPIDELVVARRAQRISQAELAARMGVSQPVVARLESAGGDVKWSTLQRFASALGLEADVVLTRRQAGWRGETEPVFVAADGTQWWYRSAPVELSAWMDRTWAVLEELATRLGRPLDVHMVQRVDPDGRFAMLTRPPALSMVGVSLRSDEFELAGEVLEPCGFVDPSPFSMALHGDGPSGHHFTVHAQSEVDVASLFAAGAVAVSARAAVSSGDLSDVSVVALVPAENLERWRSSIWELPVAVAACGSEPGARELSVGAGDPSVVRSSGPVRVVFSPLLALGDGTGVEVADTVQGGLPVRVEVGSRTSVLAVLGGPGAGKSEFARLLSDGASRLGPVVYVTACGDRIRDGVGLQQLVDDETSADLLVAALLSTLQTADAKSEVAITHAGNVGGVGGIVDALRRDDEGLASMVATLLDDPGLLGTLCSAGPALRLDAGVVELAVPRQDADPLLSTLADRAASATAVAVVSAAVTAVSAVGGGVVVVDPCTAASASAAARAARAGGAPVMVVACGIGAESSDPDQVLMLRSDDLNPYAALTGCDVEELTWLRDAGPRRSHDGASTPPRGLFLDRSGRRGEVVVHAAAEAGSA